MSERNTIVPVKFISLMRRPAHLTHEQFVDYHRNNHANTFMADPTAQRLCRKYIQSHTIPSGLHGFPASTFDGVTELWFDTLEDFNQVFTSARYNDIVRPDEHKFVDLPNSEVLLVVENSVWNPTN